MLIESSFEAGAALIAPGVIAVVGGFSALSMMGRIDRRKAFLIGLPLTTNAMTSRPAVCGAARFPGRACRGLAG